MMDDTTNIFSHYESLVGHEVLDQLYQLARPLKNLTVCHVSSTLTGGGVAEILHAMVPMTRALGIDARWEILQADPEFFQCTKSFHNGIQGNHPYISAAELSHYEEVNRQNADLLRPILKDADVVIVHDPQPAALIAHCKERKGKWIWRCHVDASRPHRPIWKYLSQFINQYDASIFSLVEFAHPMSHPMFIIPPSIDPLSPKNIELDPQEVHKVFDLFGFDPNLPMVLQVSRFDRFKDPLGVIEAYRLVKAKGHLPVQLVLAGGGASDDPEGEVVLMEIKRAAANDPNIHILELPGDAHKTINALQRAADIILQKSVKEGFGLTVTEALWKAKPVVAGNVGGIRLQVIHGQTGFLVNTPEGAAYRTRYLLQRPNEAQELGQKGREYVREKFLLTRHLREYLSLIYSLLLHDGDRLELPR